MPRARAPQQEKPPQGEVCAPQQSSPRSPQLEKARAQQQRPNAAQKKNNNNNNNIHILKKMSIVKSLIFLIKGFIIKARVSLSDPFHSSFWG